jgi:RNA polymerase sigma-70 factor (ECF subfamily)
MQFTRSLPRRAEARPENDEEGRALGRGAGSVAIAGRAPAAPDRAWLGELFRMESQWLNRFFSRRLGSANDAEDLTQETFLRFARAMPSAAIQAPQAYLRTIATNLLRDRAEHSATRWARIQLPLDEGLDCADEITPERTLEARQALDHYERLLGELAPRTLEIFLLSRLEGLRYAEIAARLGISVWAVKRAMMKAIAHIDQAREDG